AFDRPLDPAQLKNLTNQTKITYGKYVSAADRFESLRPPYAVVQMQLGTPRYDLPVYSVQMSSDRRTLILTTAPHRDALSYAVLVPGLGRPERKNTKPPVLPQEPQIDLDYNLTGAVARWEGKAAGTHWSGWLPHLDLEVARAFTAGSAEH